MSRSALPRLARPGHAAPPASPEPTRTPAPLEPGERPERPERADPAPCSAHVEWPRGLTARAALVVTHAGEKVVGPRFVRLLRAIDEVGSIRQAALSLGLGYRHAIEWIQRAESALDRPLVSRHPGRGPASGARLTAEGRHLVTVYDRVGRDIGRRLARAERELFPAAAPAKARP